MESCLATYRINVDTLITGFCGFYTSSFAQFFTRLDHRSLLGISVRMSANRLAILFRFIPADEDFITSTDSATYHRESDTKMSTNLPRERVVGSETMSGREMSKREYLSCSLGTRQLMNDLYLVIFRLSLKPGAQP